MHRCYSRHCRAFGAIVALVVILLLGAQADEAIAGNLLGLYGGGAVGQARVEAGSGGFVPSSTDHFGENHSAFKIMMGIRPISLLGAELAYIDFGHPSGSLGGAPADMELKGVAAFAVLYLPLPVFDAYVKAGGARLQSTINGNAYQACILGLPGSCQPMVPFRVDRTNTHFAAGAGVQIKFGSLAVRAEYERFTTVGGNPSLLSLGLTWKF